METQIGQLQNGMRGISVKGKVTEVAETRTFNKFGKDGAVQEVTIKDDSGKGTLVLWNEQAGTLSVGDSVTVTGAYTKEFRDSIQIHISRQGTIEKN